MNWDSLIGRIATVATHLAGLISVLFVNFAFWIMASLNFLFDTLVAFAKALGDIFKRVGTLLTRIWREHLHPFFTTVANIFEGMFDALGQLAKIIQKIIQRVRDFYNTWIGPALTDFLDFISRIRAALVVFRILGFNWAKKLDADLVQIQTAVTKAIQDIVGTLNQIISLLQVVVDPSMILRKDFFTHTLFSALPSLKRAVAYGNNRPLTPDEQAHITSYHDAVFGPNGPARVQPDGALLLHPAMAEVQAKVDARRQELGLPIL